MYLNLKVLNRYKEKKASQDIERLSSGDFIIEPVPVYISQIANANFKLIEKEELFPRISDKKAMKRFGAPTMREFNYWAWRSCGIACIQSVISTFKNDFKKTTYNLIQEGLVLNGYNTKTDVGWYHDALVTLAANYGIQSKRREFVSSPEVSLYLLKNHYVMASMESSTGGHLLLLYGFKLDTNHKLAGFWIRNPNNSNKKGESQFVSKEEFEKNFKKRIIELYI